MRVVIVGAGEVGFHIADRLSKEGHDITVIEREADKERSLSAKLNALVVHGSGASAETLEKAHVAEADLFIAVTDVDEVNLIACLLANECHVPRLIARSKSLEYSRAEWKPNAAKLGIDLIINPQSVVAAEICHIVSYSEATDVAEFARGHVVFLGYPIREESPLAGVSLRTLGAIRGIYRLVVTAITRGDETIIPRGDDEVQAGDVLYFVCNRDDLAAIGELFGVEDRETKNIFILGAGRVGREVTGQLARLKYRVKVIDRNTRNCELVAEQFDNVSVLNTDGSDVETLRSEGIEHADVFIAVTDDDQSNILCSLLAKRQGAKRAIALVDQAELVTLAPALGIDACVSPRLATAGAILKYVRRGQVVSMEVVDRSNSEVLELLLPAESPILGKSLSSLEVPRGSIIGAITRGDDVIIPGGDDHLEAGDHVVVFTLPDAINQVETFFS